MKIKRFVHRGELYVSVTDAAACYRLTTTEVEEWVREELLDAPRQVRGTRVVHASQLDRLARLVHYTRLLGLSTQTIRVLMDTGELGAENI